MNYIVVDLEWNQPMSFDSHVYREVGDRLIFEMIQIGAVKVGENFEVIDVDAHTGGYNLQIAWATGALAGTCAAEEPFC